MGAGMDYTAQGRTVERLGLAGKTPAEIATFLQEGR